MQKEKSKNTLVSLQVEQLQEIECELSNLCERVTEIIESNHGYNSALATAFRHTISDSQQLLGLIIKLTKRTQFLKFGEKNNVSN